MSALLGERIRGESRPRRGRFTSAPGFIRQALARITRRDRIVLGLLYHERLTPEEIALALHLPPATVAGVLNRVRSEILAAREKARRAGSPERRSARRTRKSA